MNPANAMDDEERRFWEFANQVAAEISEWPEWMKGGLYPEGPQFRSDQRDDDKQDVTTL